MTDERVGRLAGVLREELGWDRLTVRAWRGGADFWADLVVVDGAVAGVVRSPKVEVARTSYDGVVDFGAVIAKEALALELMAGAGVPVPPVLGRSRGERPSWILLGHVAHEENVEVPGEQLGVLTRRIHGIRPRTGVLVPEASWAEFVWGRLRQRLAAARTYADLPADSSLHGSVTSLLRTRERYATSLLHMDLRAANVCVEGGRIAAVIDVANCIVGDPLMELGRIRGYGLLGEAFRRGYGLGPLGPHERALLDVYELDTALLLTVVSVEEFDDPVLHRAQAARATRLVQGL